MPAMLEHTNFTVSNPDATAAWMSDVFGWHVRWSGEALSGGRSVHVGTDDQYVALYTPGDPAPNDYSNYGKVGGLNHVAVVTQDIEDMEDKVKNAGFQPGKHGDYEPGRRFYFHDGDGIEYEVVQYD